MKKCQKVWFPWQKPSTYGWLLETFHMVLKEKKKLIKIFHFLSQSLSLSLSLYLSISLFQLSMKKLKPWLLRGVLIYLVLLQLIMMTTIAMITLIKTIAQGTCKSTLYSKTGKFGFIKVENGIFFFSNHWENTCTYADILWYLFIQFTVYKFYILLAPSLIIYICIKWNTLRKIRILDSVWNSP